MTKTFENKQLKLHHILLISLFITPFLVLNSKVMNKRRNMGRYKERENLEESIVLRKLGFTEDTNAICEKGTDEQKEYYKTGDQEKLEINDDKIESKDNSDHVNALINLIAGTNDSTENLTNYIKHLIPVLIFFVIAILSLPGWLICCICNCCNCCCCCCCKKTSCKFPFYIITSVIYALIAGINIYGLSQSNSIFVGLADTECSILKFIGEVLDGESKETKPKWLGISNVQKLFLDTKTEVTTIQGTSTADINSQRGLINTAKKEFKYELSKQSTQINSNIDNYHYQNGYKLDILKNFGTYTCSIPGGSAIEDVEDCNDGNPTPPLDSSKLTDIWYNEYKETAKQLDSIMSTVETNYNSLHNNGAATNALDEGIKSVGDLRTTFDDVKDQISGAIIDYSDTIDQYGKLAFKLVFSVLLIIDVGIAAFITLLFFCSFQTCQNCCLKCLFKSLLHILWNILALLNFFTLLFGSFFTLFGTIGKDLIPVVEYLVSDENLNQQEPLLLGSAKQYLKKCINGNGDITGELGLNLNSLDQIDELNKAIVDIDKLKVEVQTKTSEKRAYTNYYNMFRDRKNYDVTFYIYKYDLESDTQTYHKGETPGGDILSVINLEKDTSNDKSLEKTLDSLKDKYQDFLNAETNTLDVYREKLSSLYNIFNDKLGNGNIYSILNCKFIGRNVKIILKYLKKALGKNVYNVGVCLLTAGVSMSFSIAFTILLNIIFNLNKPTPGAERRINYAS